MSRLSRIADNLVAYLLLVVGLSGSVIGFTDFIGWDISLLTPKTPISLTLLTVGLLATALGVERIVAYRRLEEHLERLEALVASSRGGQQLIGAEQIYGAMARIVSLAERRIRCLIIDNKERSPKKLTEVVAQRLRSLDRAGIPVKFEAVIAADLDKPSPDFLSWIIDRKNIYDQHKAMHLISLRLLDMEPPFGFDIYIVDQEHIFLLFSKLLGSERASVAILFENQPSIAKDFIDWYDDAVMKSSISFDEWLQRRNDPRAT